MSESDLKTWLRERRITEVECLVPDMTGNARGKILPADKFLRDDGMRLPEAIFLQTVTGEYPDDMSMWDPRDMDMILRPDIRTARQMPWAKDPTAQIIHDCFDYDGNYHELSPRNVLRRVLALYEAEGLTPIVAPELEFYLVKKNTDPDFPIEPPVGRSGRPETARQSYSIDAVNEFDPIFEDMYDFCEALELDVETLIHESGAAQIEINFQHGDAMELADQVFLFKRAMRETAMSHEVYATFMAKPMEREPGSAMHMHQSINDKNGVNIFRGNTGEPNDALLHYIGGMQTYVPAAMAIFAPNVNSYRRVCRDISAPINVDWGYDNRTCGLRVPISDPDSTRVESRFAGADANPYLMMAAALACGYLGLKQKIKPTEPLRGDAYEKSIMLTRSLESAIDKLRCCEPLREVLGDRFVRGFMSVKEKEYETFFRVISSWEREFLLLNV